MISKPRNRQKMPEDRLLRFTVTLTALSLGGSLDRYRGVNRASSLGSCDMIVRADVSVWSLVEEGPLKQRWANQRRGAVKKGGLVYILIEG